MRPDKKEQKESQFQIYNKIYSSKNKAQSNAEKIFNKQRNELLQNEYGNLSGTGMIYTKQKRKQFLKQSGFPVPSELNSPNQQYENEFGRYESGYEQHPKEIVPFQPKTELNLFYPEEQHNIPKNLGCSLQAYISMDIIDLELNMSELISKNKDLQHFIQLGGRDINRKQNYLGDQELQSFFKKKIGKQIAEQFICNYQFSLSMIQGQKTDIESCYRYIRKYVH